MGAALRIDILAMAGDDYEEIPEPPKADHAGGRIGGVRSVDFSRVPPSQWAMHDRLLNWARWCHGSSGEAARTGGESPMFRLYRSSDARREYGTETSIPVDQRDAHKIAAGVAALPFRQCKALGWYYTKGARNAQAMAREVCLSLHGLAETVIAARAALIEGGV